ncbi:hypothetical protein DPEC_G00244350 [Dallia pectoralis]|uniref:Uncharacterized protein n=1 Tax=Dallia pectoralis TaxID=75939 RepID=A0ACC2FVT2_DALPE|nr:hypothetical protein DPEC_G00244350 [Dallia pectoralis]
MTLHPPLDCGFNEDAIDQTMRILHCLLFILALIMNGVAVWVCWHLHSTSNFIVYLKNLVAADLLMTLAIPLKAANDMPSAPLALKAFCCRYSDVVFYFCMYMSIILLALISLDRFFKIVKPRGMVLGQKLVFSKVMSAFFWVALSASELIPTVVLTNQDPANNTFDFCMKMKKFTRVTYQFLSGSDRSRTSSSVLVQPSVPLFCTDRKFISVPLQNCHHLALRQTARARGLSCHRARPCPGHRTAGPRNMAFFITAYLALSHFIMGLGQAASTETQSSTVVSQCHDWGESGNRAVRVMEGEAGWLSCPLFSHPTVYNYSSAQAAGLNLVWYRVAAGQDLEQPIDFRHRDQRLSKERELLWLQPATAEDTGQYICMLRNRTSCAKIAVHMEVAPRNNDSSCSVKAAVVPTDVRIPSQGDGVLTCPDLEDVKLPNTSHSVIWYHPNCVPIGPRGDEVCSKGSRLYIRIMYDHLKGLYHCVVSYETKGRTINFTRVVNVIPTSSSGLPKEPNILNPTTDQLYPVKQGSEVNLSCRVTLPYLEGPRETWWTVNGKTLEQFADPRFTSTSRDVLTYFEDLTVENVLNIKDFSSEDLKREYNCSGRNSRGVATRRAVLVEEVYLPSVELGCGLGVTLFLMLVMFVVYHIFWLELLLLYRSWFGTDERSTDDKEYDIYISYARNSEEEQFVLLTLRRVLENELGYTVCIFDRDSLPGGTITDETLSFVGRSRRLLVVLSPGYGLQGTQALLELKAGLDSMARGGHLRVILVQFKPLGRDDWVRELKRARVALVLVRWQGEKSSDLSSRFWKRLQVELPIRRVKDSLAKQNSNAIRLQSIDIDTGSENNAIMERHLIQRVQSGKTLT